MRRPMGGSSAADARACASDRPLHVEHPCPASANGRPTCCCRASDTAATTTAGGESTAAACADRGRSPRAAAARVEPAGRGQRVAAVEHRAVHADLVAAQQREVGPLAGGIVRPPVAGRSRCRTGGSRHRRRRCRHGGSKHASCAMASGSQEVVGVEKHDEVAGRWRRGPYCVRRRGRMLSCRTSRTPG